MSGCVHHLLKLSEIAKRGTYSLPPPVLLSAPQLLTNNHSLDSPLRDGTAEPPIPRPPPPCLRRMQRQTVLSQLGLSHPFDLVIQCGSRICAQTF